LAQDGALQNRRIKGRSLMLLLMSFVLLVILFTLPFIPGAREIKKKLDAAPLFINMSYCKDPRYFAVSFRKMMLNSIGDMPEGLHEIKLSKDETVQIVDNKQNIDGTVVNNVLYVLNDLDLGNAMTFKKEIYARGSVSIGESNHLQALACDGDVHILRGTHFLRWLDAVGNVRIDEECHLGISATCLGELSIAGKCKFNRLYGFPIVTTPEDGFAGHNLELAFADDAISGPSSTERDISDMPPHSLKSANLIANSALSIGEHSVIHGHIKAHGKIVVGASVTVLGNLFAEEDIEIGPGCRILGSVFSQGCVTVRQGAIIGIRNRIKSIVGKRGVFLEKGVQVYGYILTEGKGMVI
jgi:hypothetical protein